MQILEAKNLPESDTSKLIEKIEGFLKEGKVLLFPTDTIYGLIADATNEKAVKKIFKIKKRNPNKPMPVFVASIAAAKRIAEISKKEEEFLKKVWPGKVTVVLKRRKDCGLAKALFGKEQTIGLRLPNYPLLNKLLEKIKTPLAETSVNISGQPALTKIEEITKQFRNKKHQPDVIIDVGNLEPANPSQVIDISKGKPLVLRS